MLGWTSWTSWLLGAVVSLVAIMIWRDRRRYWKLQEIGLPGPYPLPLLGSIIPFFTLGFIETFKMWKKKYGSVYCIFSNIFAREGIVISDLDLVKEVMVKQFMNFPNRAARPVTLGKPWDDALTTVRDDHWKHVRSQLSPTFSTGKIKKTMPAVQRVCVNLQKAVQKKAENGELVELKALSGTYSMDVTAGAAFGIQTDSVHNPDDAFLKHALAFETPRRFTLMVAVLFPKLLWLLRKLDLGFVPKQCEQFFLSITESALTDRRQDEKKHSDFLQLLLEAEREGEQQKQVDQEIDHGDQLATSKQWTRRGLSHDEMQANAMLFIQAGFANVSTVMSFTLFSLAAHPQCLQKAQAEVDEKLGKRPVDFDTANQLTYLEMCVNEALRLYPPGFIVNREVHDDTELGGFKLKKGLSVTIPIHCIHTDPDIWPEPMKFDPERHTPEAKATRHPFAFLPFGMGPRNCIGMRLAQLEVRMALASVLQKVSPVLCEKSVYPPRLTKMRMMSRDGLWVKFKARE